MEPCKSVLAGLLLAALPSLVAGADRRAPDLPSMAAVRQELGLKGMGSLRIDMDIRSVFGGSQYELADRVNRLDMNVSEDSGGRGYQFSGNVDGRYVTGQVVAQSDGSPYRIWSSGLNLEMRPSGDGSYEISGFVDELDGSKYLRVTLRQRGTPGSFSIWESGFNGDVSRFGSDARLSGQMESGRFGKKSLACVGVFIAVIESQLNQPR